MPLIHIAKRVLQQVPNLKLKARVSKTLTLVHKVKEDSTFLQTKTATLKLISYDLDSNLNAHDEVTKISDHLNILKQNIDVKTYELQSNRLISMAIPLNSISNLNHLTEHLAILNYNIVVDNKNYKVFSTRSSFAKNQITLRPNLAQHEKRLLTDLHHRHPGLQKTYISKLDI